MKCNAKKVMNIRFRALNIEGNTYTLDMSQSIWRILFPFLIWILPNTVYQVDKEVLNQKVGSVENATKINKVSVLLFSGIGISIANWLRPLTDSFYFESSMLNNGIIATIMLISVATLRFYLSHRNKKSFYKTVGLHLLSKKSIWIRPQSYKHLMKSLSLYFFFLLFFLFTFILYIKYSNMMLLISATVFLLFLSVTNGTTVIEGTTTVKFKEVK